MGKRLHTHKVNINDRRRENKKTNDVLCKGISKQALHQVFSTHYRDQLRALYRAVFRFK